MAKVLKDLWSDPEFVVAQPESKIKEAYRTRNHRKMPIPDALQKAFDKIPKVAGDWNNPDFIATKTPIQIGKAHYYYKRIKCIPPLLQKTYEDIIKANSKWNNPEFVATRPDQQIIKWYIHYEVRKSYIPDALQKRFDEIQKTKADKSKAEINKPHNSNKSCVSEFGGYANFVSNVLVYRYSDTQAIVDVEEVSRPQRTEPKLRNGKLINQITLSKITFDVRMNNEIIFENSFDVKIDTFFDGDILVISGYKPQKFRHDYHAGEFRTYVIYGPGGGLVYKSTKVKDVKYNDVIGVLSIYERTADNSRIQIGAPTGMKKNPLPAFVINKTQREK